MRVKHLVFVGAGAFLLFLIAFMPASSALRFASLPSSFSYRSVAGSIWNMEFSDVSIYGRPVGRLTLGTGLSVLAGGLNGHVRLDGQDIAAEFDLEITEQIAVENLNLTMGLSGRIASVTFDGAMRVQDAAVELQPSGRCLSASGRIRTNAFEEMFATLGMSRDAVDADLTCAGGYLQTSFSRSFSDGDINVTGSIIEPSVLNMAVLLRFDDQTAIPQEVLEWLETNGFQATEDGWQTTARAQL